MKMTIRWVLIALIVAGFVSDGLTEVRLNWNSSGGDQGSYLRLGMRIKEGAALTDGNRHPLYPLLLAPFAEREWAYFTKAKLLSLAIGTATLLIVYALSRRMYNDDVALIASLLLSINQRFRLFSASVMCEPLLVLLTFLTWHFTVKGFSNRRQWIIAGFLGGLAYLTKGSGSLLLLAFLISNAIIHRGKLIRRDVLLFPLFFLIASLPLLVYNFEVYRNPFYNVNTAHVMWFDRWEDKWAGEKPTMLSYLKTHTMGEILARQWAGMREILPVLMEALIPKGWGHVGSMTVVALSVGLICLGGRDISHLEIRRGRLAFTGALFAVFYLAFAWYAQVTLSSRFFIPLAPVAYLTVAELAYDVGRRVQARLSMLRWGVSAGHVLLACVVIWMSAGSASHILENPFESDVSRNVDRENVLLWLMERAGSSPIVRGPSHSLPTWKYPELDLKTIPLKIEDWGEFTAYLQSKGARYVLLDEESFSRREALLSRFFFKEGTKLDFLSLPPGWKLALAYKGLPCHWCVFRLFYPEEVSTDHPLEISLGQKIRLIGYDLDIWPLKPEGEELIQLTLYWKAISKVEKDYTVFTHLLKEGKIWAQMDGYPVRGRRPTSTWRVGEILADHYHLLVPPDALAGEYRIGVGMYLLETMERLAACESGVRLPEDMVLLDRRITIER